LILWCPRSFVINGAKALSSFGSHLLIQLPSERHLSIRSMPGLDQGPQSSEHRGAAERREN